MRQKFLSLFLASFLSQNLIAEVELHVAPNGNDQAEGTAADPLGTLSGARDRIRTLRAEASTSQPFTVFIHAGRYELESTFELNAEDSGSPESPVTYRSVDGKVIVSGGRQLTNWRPLEDAAQLAQLSPDIRSSVVVTDVRSLSANLDSHPRRLHEGMSPEHSELFIGNRRLPLAQWPNEGWANSKRVDAKSWARNPNSHADHAWAVGFWENDWTMSCEPIQTTESKWSFTDPQCPKNLRESCRFKICNALSELDQPGEWYLDREQSQILYLPDGSDSANVTLSVLENVLSVYDADNIRFEGVRFEACRSMVAEVVRGSHVVFEDCQFADAGNVGVHLYGGEFHGLYGCEVSTTGSSAIRIEAGDRETLTPCHHFIEACEIHDFGQHYMAGRAGIALFGVGATVAGNRICEAPDLAIGIYGNDHVIEHNEVFHVCQETDDSGAIYLGYDPTFRGNRIRSNYVHDLGGFSKTGIMGIYLDDYASGATVESNYLQNCIRGIAVGGGRDNHLRGNVIHGGLAAIQIDARGLTWFQSHVQGHDSRIQTLCRNTLDAFPIYGDKYPALATFLNDEPELPKGNRVEFNEFNCRIGIDLQMANKRVVEQKNNIRQSATEPAADVIAKLGLKLWKQANQERETTVLVDTVVDLNE